MKKVLGAIVTVAGVFVAAIPSQVSAQQKIGYIDSRRIIAEAPGSKEAQATFEKDMERWRNELKAQQDSLTAMVSDFETKMVTLSPAAKKTRQDALAAKSQAFQQKQQEMEERANRRQSELVAPIMQKINRVISDLRKEGSFSMIFDVAGGSVIAADSTLDLNDEVLTKLKAGGGAASAGDGAAAPPRLTPQAPAIRPKP